MWCRPWAIANRMLLVLCASLQANSTLKKSARKRDRKSTRLNSSHSQISYAVFCLKKKTQPAHNASKRARTLSRSSIVVVYRFWTVHGIGNAYVMIAAKSQVLISRDHETGYSRKHEFLAGSTIDRFCVLHDRTYGCEVEKRFAALEFQADPGIW